MDNMEARKSKKYGAGNILSCYLMRRNFPYEDKRKKKLKTRGKNAPRKNNKVT